MAEVLDGYEANPDMCSILRPAHRRIFRRSTTYDWISGTVFAIDLNR